MTAKDRTKIASSRREYLLLPGLKEMLKKIHAEQKKNKKLFGKDYNKKDYVFTRLDRLTYGLVYITQEFNKVLAKNKFLHMRFYDL